MPSEKEWYPLEKVASGLWVVQVPDVKKDFFEVRDIFKSKEVVRLKMDKLSLNQQRS